MNIRKPKAAMLGPMTSGNFAPWRFTNPPDQRDRKNKMRIKGI
jgi:hypothetical protein